MNDCADPTLHSLFSPPPPPPPPPPLPPPPPPHPPPPFPPSPITSSMKGHLKSYLSPCLQAALTMVTDKHSGDIRSSAILAVAKLFEAYVQVVNYMILLLLL